MRHASCGRDAEAPEDGIGTGESQTYAELHCPGMEARAPPGGHLGGPRRRHRRERRHDGHPDQELQEGVYEADLCAPLCRVAEKKCADKGWTNAEEVEG